ncbi:unnamed protein product [Bursaphelenchus okinawaensis]|uniref:Aquaporin n=1 Tax=Bursaphelenchus okinawaensis TaxID=465554 RepID=A0A811LEG8_9BILA|nr:unnamed protein product [Bursaphelenchus okinawaensis]CAG9121541.1 unnamed protein product [Bursaphelenchus okinawaensis]
MTLKKTPIDIETTGNIVCFKLPTTTEVLEQSRQQDEETPRLNGLVGKLAAEFLGTCLFVFVGSLSGLGTNKTNGIMHAAVAHGFTIFVLASSFGGVSGGHFNPAVSLSVCMAGKLDALLLMPYVIAQLLGGCVGALLVVVVTTEEQYHNILGGATMPGGNLWYQNVIVETMLTIALCNTVIMCAADTDTNMLAPLCIGFTVALDIVAAGSITGASMNPARSLGPGLVATIFLPSKDTKEIWQEHYIYWAGPIIGATLAAFFYRCFFASDKRLVE